MGSKRALPPPNITNPVACELTNSRKRRNLITAVSVVLAKPQRVVSTGPKLRDLCGNLAIYVLKFFR
jgi:hypothetical protein